MPLFKSKEKAKSKAKDKAESVVDDSTKVEKDESQTTEKGGQDKKRDKNGNEDGNTPEKAGAGENGEEGSRSPEEAVVMDAGEIDGTADIPEEYRGSDGKFKSIPVPPRHQATLTKRRPPLALVVGVAGVGKSRLSSALLGGKENNHRAVFRVGTKTTAPKIVVGERLSVVDTPGLPDPMPRSSDTYYNDTVKKLRSIGYANAVIFLVNQERVTPTLIKNYGILYRAFNKLPCAKVFVLRRESSFAAQSINDQAMHEEASRQVVNNILEAAKLKRWRTQQFFMWTKGSGEEQDKQIKYIKDHVKSSPRVDVTPTEGLQLTVEAAAAAQRKAEALAKASEDATGSKRNSKKRESRASSKSPPRGKERKDGSGDSKSGCSLM